MPHKLLSLIALITVLFAIAPLRSMAEQAQQYVPVAQTLELAAGASRMVAGTPLTYDPVAAPKPFSHILLHTIAELPEGSAVQLEVRVASTGDDWTEWRVVERNDDLTDPGAAPGDFWSQIFEVGGLASFWQVRATPVANGDGLFPTLQRVDVHTVETLSGPLNPPADLSGAQRSAAPIPMALSRPPVVSRTSWGSPDGQGSRKPARYANTTHLVVHHTADSNSLRSTEPNWAARVRAIWSYHAITLGWGDIGYNYLIDPNGVVYEGRAGGDNAVGFHDTANYGSMGVSMLGTYQSVAPTQATQDALVKLLAWKANQQDINPFGSAYYDGCSISSYCYPYNDNSVVPTLAGHRQVTPGHTSCPGDATMALMPSIRERVRQAINNGQVPEAQVAITNVWFPRTTIAAGELLEVQVTIRNTGAIVVNGQAPQVDLNATSAFNTYVYRADECFNGAPDGRSPVFEKVAGSVRITLGTPNWDSANVGRCNGGTSNYPWRWGLNGSLNPGQERTIIGYVHFTQPGSYTVRAGAVQEYVGYLAQDVGATTISVTAEQRMPEATAYDTQLQPLGHIFSLPDTPSAFLARLDDPASLPIGRYAGSLPWAGERLDWGDSGPFGLSDNFVLMQTRAFEASVAGSYSFRLTSDDGAWLLVDGRIIAANAGLHPTQTAMVTLELARGMHTVSFIGFEATGKAYSAYDYQPPGSSEFIPIPDVLTSQPRVGANFSAPPQFVFAADDLGGSGIGEVRWSLNDGPWESSSSAIVSLGQLQRGSYTLRYQPRDRVGNAGAMRELNFAVESVVPQPSTAIRLFLPGVQAP